MIRVGLICKHALPDGRASDTRTQYDFLTISLTITVCFVSYATLFAARIWQICCKIRLRTRHFRSLPGVYL